MRPARREPRRRERDDGGAGETALIDDPVRLAVHHPVDRPHAYELGPGRKRQTLGRASAKTPHGMMDGGSSVVPPGDRFVGSVVIECVNWTSIDGKSPLRWGIRACRA